MAKKSKTQIELELSQFAAWNGDILEAEAKKPGGRLMGALMSCAAHRGQLQQDLAAYLDVTYGYLSQLRTGKRSVAAISEKFARSCAKYLKVSTLKVMLLAGKLAPQDLVEPEGDYESQLRSAVDFVFRDGRFGHLITPTLRDADADTRYGLIQMYERATGTRLLPPVSV